MQADVAVSVYEGTGTSIHLPLGRAHPLVAVVAQALSPDQKSANEKVRLALGNSCAIHHPHLVHLRHAEFRPY